MVAKLEYYCPVKRATIGRFALVTSLLFGVATCGAQINAAPPSVTSLGFGGRPINGAPPSVTSLGPRGFSPGFNPAFPNSRPFFGTNPNPPLTTHDHHHHHGGFPGAAVYAVPYYTYYDNGDEATADAPEEYNGGPTIFDRRGPGYVPRPPAETYPPAEAASAASALQPPASPQPPTVLVFKDGHQLEIENYAIVGGTLYDLTGGQRHKISVSDLDLQATTKQNDDRGIDFQIPSGSE